MVFVFFIYGLAFFILGFAVFIYPKKDSSFKLAKGLWLVGAFGILHGMNEWIDMFMFIQRPQEFLLLKVIRALLMPLSFIFLLQFGAKIIAETRKGFGWLKNLSFILPLAWVCIFVLTRDRFLYGDIWGRYLLGFPGAMLAAYALILQSSNFKDVKIVSLKKNLKIAVFFFAAYAVLSGIIVPQAGFFPATIINYTLFLQAFGFPVQALRALSAVMIAVSLGKVLVIFYWETKSKLQNTLEDFHAANEELQVSNEDLRVTTEELQASSEKLRVTAEKLQKEKGFAKVIAENIQEGIMLLDRDFKIIWANKKIMGLTGIKEDEVFGGYCYAVTHHLDEPCKPPHDACPIHEVLATGKAVSITHTHFDKQGNKFYAEVTAYPVKNEKGEVIQFIHVARDITERVKLEEEIKKKVFDLERFNKLAVGRELMMKELKVRIAELEAKISHQS